MTTAKDASTSLRTRSRITATNPHLFFYGNEKRYFGVELEVDESGKDNDNAATLKSIANTHEENIYIKSDGSLEDGFEIVSHPMTLEYHTEEMNWKALLWEAVSMGYRSHLAVCTFTSTAMPLATTRQNRKMSSADPVLCGKALERVVHIQSQKQLQHEPLECKVWF